MDLDRMATEKKKPEPKAKPLPSGVHAFERRAREELEKKGIKTLTLQSLQWFEREVKKNITMSTMSHVNKFGVNKQKFEIGQLVLYKYDPKWKEELPYYDTMPLVLVTSINKDGWTGLAFHYLPPRIRTWILNQLYENNKRKDIVHRDKVHFNWVIAKRIAAALGAHKHLQHSVKRYLVSHVKSVPLVIDAASWDLVVYLPLARFKKGQPY